MAGQIPRPCSKNLTVMATDSCLRIKHWLMGLGLLIVVAAVVLAGKQHRMADTMHYQVQPVKKGDLVITVTATGNLETNNQVEVAASCPASSRR